MEQIPVGRASEEIERAMHKEISQTIDKEVDKAVRLALLRRKGQEVRIISTQRGMKKISKAAFISIMGREIIESLRNYLER